MEFAAVNHEADWGTVQPDQINFRFSSAGPLLDFGLGRMTHEIIFLEASFLI